MPARHFATGLLPVYAAPQTVMPSPGLPIDLSRIPALVLAGGLGTRLRSVVPDVPKVLAPVRGRPFLAYLLDQLESAGFRRVVLCTGYRGDLVQAEFGSCFRSLEIAYSHESEPLGTGGAMRLALPHVAADLVLALNGDSYCDCRLEDFAAWHSRHGFTGSLVLTEVPDTARYGRVALNDAGRIERFEEKGSVSGRGWINAGLYLIPTGLLARVPAGQTCSFERDLLPAWIGQPFGGYQCPGKFLDIGTPESFAQTEAFFSGTGANR